MIRLVATTVDSGSKSVARCGDGAVLMGSNPNRTNNKVMYIRSLIHIPALSCKREYDVAKRFLPPSRRDQVLRPLETDTPSGIESRNRQ